MEIIFRASFKRDIKKVKDRTLLKKLSNTLKNIEAAESIKDIPNCKKIQAAKAFYRVRLGDYRLGFKFENDQINAIRFLHRRDMYRYFP